MGIAEKGRSLVAWHALSMGLVIAAGCVAYIYVGFINDQIRAAVTDQSTAAILSAVGVLSNGIIIATSIVAVFMSVVLAMLVGKERSLNEAADAVDQLAAGAHTIKIPGLDRHDAIGMIARGVDTLRQDAIRHREGATSEETASAQNAEDRARKLSANIEIFSRDLAQQIQRLGSMTKRLGDAADGMIVAARHASNGSEQATTASSNAAGDVSSVATASEQLLDSIEEISRQVVQSTNVVRSAVERAVETNDGMGRLSSAAQKVGDVVSLISRIAAQTNLLALNATIEAARAGEAGRGFAVVAQEVKTLATQTAKATQEISGQIGEMQQATDLSVDAIDKIQKKISEVEHISTIIAAAVHEQGAATQEIARNVRSAAAGTSSMSSHMENVVRSVSETSDNASSVAHLARDLDDIAKGMTDLVDKFAKDVRAA